MENGFTYDRLVGLLNYLVQNALILGEVIAFAAIIFYGLQMTASRGDAAKFGKAKDALIKACIGAALILGVYTILATVQGAAQSLTH